MKTIIILVGPDGMGREKNPHAKRISAFENEEHFNFEQTVQYLLAFTPDNKPAEPGEYEAELVWQFKLYDWFDADMEPFENFEEFKMALFQLRMG